MYPYPAEGIKDPNHRLDWRVYGASDHLCGMDVL